MEPNMLESNERTLVMFDVVCSGLANCLSMVHADIKQMTEHRNKLANLEHQQIQAKLTQTHQVPASCNLNNNNNNTNNINNNNNNNNNNITKNLGNLNSCNEPCGEQQIGNTTLSKTARKLKQQNMFPRKSVSVPHEESDQNSKLMHDLAALKLFDQRLADSFNKALNLSDPKRSLITAQSKQQDQTSAGKASIFQVLLGKSAKSSSVALATNKSDNLRCTGAKTQDNRALIDDINKQTRLAMQYSKQLEAHLFRLEDLRSKYEMHLKMGLSVRSVSRAYLNPETSVSAISLNNYAKTSSKKHMSTASKTTIKEFIENVERIENEVESYMGSFLLAVEDIQGFARVCQGDVFEISIKYGDSQKFKTRISVLKDNKQKCDNRQSVFKARIADVLAIKAYECKGLGKRTLLGHKLCETRDLFTARSQLMTISLNQTGSIKLNLIVTWNPLHMTPSSAIASLDSDITHISLPPASMSSSSMSSAYSISSIHNTTTIKIKSENRNRLDNKSVSPSISDQALEQQAPESLYQTVDPTYGYYIPPPDYQTNELRHQRTR